MLHSPHSFTIKSNLPRRSLPHFEPRCATPASKAVPSLVTFNLPSHSRSLPRLDQRKTKKKKKRRRDSPFEYYNHPHPSFIVIVLRRVYPETSPPTLPPTLTLTSFLLRLLLFLCLPQCVLALPSARVPLCFKGEATGVGTQKADGIPNKAT